MTDAGDTRGILLVVSAPSGAGKSTLVRALLEREPGLHLSVSHTTRPPRAGEVDGRDYHFVSRQAFRAMVEADRFFEHAEVHGDLKGTSLDAVMPSLEAGTDILLELDWQGARQVRKRVAACQTIFILPPSRAELERRLRHRASDSETAIQRRLRDSRADIAHAEEFDFVVVNDVFEQAVNSLQGIVHALRAGRAAPAGRHQALIAELLAQTA